MAEKIINLAMEPKWAPVLCKGLIPLGFEQIGWPPSKYIINGAVISLVRNIWSCHFVDRVNPGRRLIFPDRAKNIFSKIRTHLISDYDKGAEVILINTNKSWGPKYNIGDIFTITQTERYWFAASSPDNSKLIVTRKDRNDVFTDNPKIISRIIDEQSRRNG